MPKVDWNFVLPTHKVCNIMLLTFCLALCGAELTRPKVRNITQSNNKVIEPSKLDSFRNEIVRHICTEKHCQNTEMMKILISSEFLIKLQQSSQFKLIKFYILHTISQECIQFVLKSLNLFIRPDSCWLKIHEKLHLCPNIKIYLIF